MSVDPTTHQPVPLSITQTPAALPAGQSRVDFYATVTLNTILQLPDELKTQVQAVVGDAYYTKLKFIARVVDEGPGQPQSRAVRLRGVFP